MLALLGCIACGYIAISRYFPASYNVNFHLNQSQSADLHLIGFYGVERNETDVYRWSKAIAAAQLPLRYHTGKSYMAAIRFRSVEQAESRPLTFWLNQRILATVTPSTDFRQYNLVLPQAQMTDTPIQFALRTTPFVPPADQRELGVMVTQISLTQLPFIDWAPVVMVPTAFPALWIWSRRRGTTMRATAILCTALGLMLLTFYALYQAAPLPYLWLALPAIIASGVAVTLAYETVARLTLSLLVTFMSFSGMLWPSWFSDDAFISFRYAQNLVAGHGLVYNVGERVEGYTNFLWTMLAALTLCLGADPVFWAYVAGVTLALSVMLATYTLARRHLTMVWALAATLIVTTSQSLMVYTSRGAGLETGLFTLLVLLGSDRYIYGLERSLHGTPLRRLDNLPAVYGDSRRNTPLNRWAFPIAGILIGVATLTRPEGAMLMALTMAHLFFSNLLSPSVSGKRNLFRTGIQSILRILPLLVPYILIVVPFFLWRFWYYGDLLPNTFYAKTGGGLHQIMRGLAYASVFGTALGGPLLFVIPAAPLLNRGTLLRPWWNYVLLVVSAYTSYIIAVGGDHFPGERFFVPLVPWVALLMAEGFAAIAQYWQRRSKQAGLAALIVLSVILISLSYHALRRSEAFDRTLVGNDESVWIWRDLGLWLHDNTPSDTTVAALGAGAIAYYSDRTIIDLLGLTDKHIARVTVAHMGQGTAGHEKRDPTYVLTIRRPMYIPKMWDEYFGGAARLQDRYRLITILTHSGRELELWERLP